MKQPSKRFRAAKARIEEGKLYATAEAVVLLKQCEPAKFDETVEVVVKLGVNPKATEQAIRGSFALPHGIGKERKVIVFAEGKQAEDGKKSGAIEVGTTDLAKKIEEGWLDFDIAIATPASMRFVGKLGRILGPQGKMPSPKSGTVTDDVAGAVKEFRAGKIEYRLDAGANVHVPVGKRSFPEKALQENVDAFIEHIKSVRPSAAKGVYLQKAVLSSTMGPAIPLVVS